MSVLGGAKIPGGSLVVGLDPANPKFSSPAGGSGHKSGSGTVVSHQLLSNMNVHYVICLRWLYPRQDSKNPGNSILVIKYPDNLYY